MKPRSIIQIAAAAGLLGGLARARASYRRWQRAELLRLAAGSRVATTARGPLEYADTGRGPIVLISHGSFGGYDQGLWFAQALGLNGFRVLAVSRGGYLRTPLTTAETPEAMADACATLLDMLEIQRAAIIGISAGGPAALQFALRYPDRCWGLVMLSAVSRRDVLSPVPETLARALFPRIANLPFWLADLGPRTRHTAQLLILAAFVHFPDMRRAVVADPQGRDLLAGILAGASMPSQRNAGILNDHLRINTLPRYPLERITAPTLVVQGMADTAVSPDEAEYTARSIPGATRAFFDRGGHLLPLTHPDAGHAVVAFLQAHGSAIQETAS